MSGIRTVFTSNLVTKALALVLAVLVWYFVELEVSSKEQRPNVKVRIPFDQQDLAAVEITDAPDGGKPIDAVDVVLSGPKGALSDVGHTLECVHVVPEDVSRRFLPDRRYPIALSASDLHLPARLSATLKPDQVWVKVDKLVDGWVGLDTRNCVKGQLRPGLVCRVGNVRPPQIQFRAPAAVIERYRRDGLPIIPFDVTPFSATVELQAAFPESVRQGIRPNQVVWVTLVIEPEPVVADVTVPLRFLTDPQPKYRFTLEKPKEVMFKVKGPREVVQKFTGASQPPIDVWVDVVNYNVSPLEVGGKISPKIGYRLTNPEQYPGLQILDVPDTAEQVKVEENK